MRFGSEASSEADEVAGEVAAAGHDGRRTPAGRFSREGAADREEAARSR